MPRMWKEIATLVKSAGDAPVKVILETSCLNHEEKIAVCQMSLRAGAGAADVHRFRGVWRPVEDVQLIKGTVGAYLDIKAAGVLHLWGRSA